MSISLSPIRPRLHRNVWVLAAVSALTMSCVSMMALISGLLGTQLAPNPRWATLPTGMIVIGTASSALWAPLWLRRWGRTRGSYLGFVAAGLAALAGFIAASTGQFAYLLVCGFLNGIGVAFWQQFRFAAIESESDPQRYGTVLSVFMMGGLASAIIGPEIGAVGRDLMAQPYAGSFALLGALLGVALLLYQGYRELSPPSSTQTHISRPLGEILRSPRFLVASLTAGLGFGVMSFIMTATPINMHEICGIPLSDTKRVIQAHILAMFAPSLLSGWFMAKLGKARMMGIGAAMFGVVLIIGLQGQELVHFWGSLVLLGFGWNFLFVTGTAMLPEAYRPEEKFKVQAANDVIVFGSQAIASLSAGWVLFTWGWNVQLMICAPLVFVAGALAGMRKRIDTPSG